MKKELLEEFIAAKWKTPEEIRAFVAKVNELTSEEVVSLLDILTSKRIVVGSQEQAHRLRIFSELAKNISNRELFEPYLRAIKCEDKNLRTVLTPLIAKVESIHSRTKICDLLKSPDSHLRRTAVQILQSINDANVLKYIGELFKDRNFPGRLECLDLAGANPGHHSVELFKGVMGTGRPPEKVKVLKYLVTPNFLKGNQRIILGVVKPALLDPDESVITEAIAAYARICSEEEYFDNVGGYLHCENIRLVRSAVEGLSHFSSGRTIATLERKLYIGPNMIRLAVLEAVQQIGTTRVCKVLLKALEHKSNLVRERASEVLTKLSRDGKLRVADSIFWLLRSEDPNVKSMAIKLVAALPEKKWELWADVLTLVYGEDWWIRQRIVDTLVEIAGEGLTPHIVKYLGDPSDVTRRFSLEMLLRLKSPLSLEAVLNTARQDEDWWVREKAIGVLAEINNSESIPILLEIGLKEPVFRVPVIDAMKKMGAKSAAPRIAQFLTSDNPDVRLAALQCLESFNDTKFSAAILPCVKDRDLKVRHLAQDIAKKWNIAHDGNKGGKEEALPIIDRLLIAVRNAEGDDLILLPENTPYLKKHGKTVPLIKNKFSEQQMRSILMHVLTAQQKDDLQNLSDIDFSYEVRSEGLRFRANIFTSRTGISAVFRIIKGDVWKLEDLGLPPVVNTFGDFKNGLVLVGGPTGSGKSTTLSTIIAYINRTSRRHVISIEDPIEAVHRSEMGLINQREVGVHTPSFNHALRMTLREDPDVILVGEMRDLPTIQFAVTAAETGHLVFGTVHTVSADSTVDRLVNAYPAESQEQVRSMLADSLRAVLCQYLIRSKENNKMVLAAEIMLNNNAISNLIRKGKTFQLPSVIVTSKEQQMQMMDTSLMELYKKGKISADEAYLKARNKTDFEELVGLAKDATLSDANSPLSKK
jgi:twitching motility protein PilT